MAATAKLWWQSRTLWFNAVVNGGVAIWQVVSPHSPLSADQIAMVNLVGNTVLRFITTSPVVAEKPPTP